MTSQILRMENITKVYSNGVVANENINFSVEKGEIHALMGENGAGKSTLMKILFGIEGYDAGKIYINGEEVQISSSTDALNLGIGMVHQHFMLVPSLSVAENMILGMTPTKYGILDLNKAISMTEEVCKKYNLILDPRAKVETLSVGNKQKLEILKALIRGAKILILDEPTAVLTPQETKELFKELINLKNEGYTIIFISHKLKEIKAICNRITVIRHGKLMGVKDVNKVSEADISKLMVGRDVILTVEKKATEAKEKVLEVKNLTVQHQDTIYLNNISFSVRKRQIIGVAGVEGNGQTQLVESITGLRKIKIGSVKIDGQSINEKNIKEIRDLKVSHVPGDRMSYGVASEATISDNLLSDKFSNKHYSKGMLLNKEKIENYTKNIIGSFKVYCKSGKQEVGMLSGGNIQKVVIGREFTSNPKFLVADQPTRGVDVGAAEFIHKELVKLRDKDVAVLLVSADLNEILELSDSVIVMYCGEIVAFIKDSKNLKEDELGEYMLGLKKQSECEIMEAINGY